LTSPKVLKILVKKHHKQRLENLTDRKLMVAIHQKRGSSGNKRTWTKEKPLDRLPRLIRFQL
jgi:hypothetical protein